MGKNTVIVILLILLAYLSFLWIRTPKITDLFVGIPTVTDIGDAVSVDGAWLPPIIPSENRTPFDTMLTNTSIFCYRPERICRETRAVISRLTGNFSLQSWAVEYSVQTWDDNIILATNNLPVRTDELRINLKQQSATLTQTEKNSKTAALQPFVWELVGTDEAIKRFKELSN